MESERMRDALFASSRPANLRSSISSFSLSPCVRVAFTHSQSLTRAHPHSLSHTHTLDHPSYRSSAASVTGSRPSLRDALFCSHSRALSPLFFEREKAKKLYTHTPVITSSRI